MKLNYSSSSKNDGNSMKKITSALMALIFTIMIMPLGAMAEQGEEVADDIYLNISFYVK